MSTGPASIGGTFNGLPQGAEFILGYGGQCYRYVANYYGGDGNDFTLVWAENHPATWGYGAHHQLATGSTVNQPAPVLVNSPLLAGRTILDGSAGFDHSLILCSDGTLLGWGTSLVMNSAVPVILPNAGALAGKRIARISSCIYHAVALCTDGTLVALGRQSAGPTRHRRPDGPHRPRSGEHHHCPRRKNRHRHFLRRHIIPRPLFRWQSCLLGAAESR